LVIVVRSIFPLKSLDSSGLRQLVGAIVKQEYASRGTTVDEWLTMTRIRKASDVNRILPLMTAERAEILVRYYALGGGSPESPKEIASAIGATSQRVSQVRPQALRSFSRLARGLAAAKQVGAAGSMQGRRRAQVDALLLAGVTWNAIAAIKRAGLETLGLLTARPCPEPSEVVDLDRADIPSLVRGLDTLGMRFRE
jgi:hypothetical protein